MHLSYLSLRHCCEVKHCYLSQHLHLAVNGCSCACTIAPEVSTELKYVSEGHLTCNRQVVQSFKLSWCFFKFHKVKLVNMMLRT